MITGIMEHYSDIVKQGESTALTKYCIENQLEPIWEKTELLSLHNKELMVHKTV